MKKCLSAPNQEIIDAEVERNTIEPKEKPEQFFVHDMHPVEVVERKLINRRPSIFKYSSSKIGTGWISLSSDMLENYSLRKEVKDFMGKAILVALTQTIRALLQNNGGKMEMRAIESLLKRWHPHALRAIFAADGGHWGPDFGFPDLIYCEPELFKKEGPLVYDAESWEQIENLDMDNGAETIAQPLPSPTPEPLPPKILQPLQSPISVNSDKQDIESEYLSSDSRNLSSDSELYFSDGEECTRLQEVEDSEDEYNQSDEEESGSIPIKCV